MTARTYLEMLTPITLDWGADHVVYDLEEVERVATRVVRLNGDSVLAVHVATDGSSRTMFGVFDFHHGPVTRDGESVAGVRVVPVFHGYGFSGPLRELRHTWWGEDGYLPSPPGEVITRALAALGEWFDL